VFLAACAARFWLAATRPLWHDEIFTLWLSRSAPSAIFSALHFDSGPALFYLLIRPFTMSAELWALPDSAVRALPFLAIALLAFGVRSLPRGESRAWFVVLISTSVLLTYYSAEARAYALLALLDFALFLLLRSPGRHRGAFLRACLIALCAAAALHTHYLALFFVAAAGLTALLERRGRDAAALAAGAVLFLPWLPVLLRQPPEATAWMRDSLPRSVAGFLSSLGGVGRVPPAFGFPPATPLFWLAAAAGAATLALLLPAAKRDAEVRAGLLVSGAFLAAVLAASLLRPIAFAGRTELAILPVWIWTIARAVPSARGLRAAAWAHAVLGAIALATCLPTPRHEPSGPRVSAALSGLARPTDLVVAGAAFYLPARLARDRGALAAPLQGFPREVERHPGWFPLKAPPEEAYRELEAALSSRPAASRVWIAVHPLFATRRMGEVLARRGTLKEALRDSDVLVLVWTAPP
jgi:mannosyltransferase